MRRSISRAMIAVSTRTATTMASRCQDGISPYSTSADLFLNSERSNGCHQCGATENAQHFSRLWERASSCEAVLDRVPEPDLVLAEPPAEQHLLVAASRREVDQALVEILDEDPERLQRLDAPYDLRRFGVDRRLQSVDLVRADTAAVGRDRRGNPGVPHCRERERAPVRDRLLDERPYLRQELVRLVSREIAIRHAYMFSVSGPARRPRRGHVRRERDAHPPRRPRSRARECAPPARHRAA